MGKEVSATGQRAAMEQAVSRGGRGREAWRGAMVVGARTVVTAVTVWPVVIAAMASRGVMAEAVSPRAMEVAVWTTAIVKTAE